MPFPVPLTAVDPLGGLIYNSSATAEIAASGESDRFTIDLDDGQTITVVVDPDAQLQPTIELLDPDGTPIGSAAAAAVGEDAVLQTVPTTAAGTYTVTVGSASHSTGPYTVQLILNAAVEWESHNGPGNNDPAAAQDLDPSFMALADGSAERGAVIGTMPSPFGVAVDSEDFESGTLNGQWTTYSSSPAGRIEVVESTDPYTGSYYLHMSRDRQAEEGDNLNEAVWTVDLSNPPYATLTFRHWAIRSYWDEGDGGCEAEAGADGVAISDDGVSWYPVWTPETPPPDGWNEYTVDLAAQATEADMSLGPGFEIKFQQYDNGQSDDPWWGRGCGYDDIMITTPVLPPDDWYCFSLDDGETATVALTKTATPLPWVAPEVTLELYDDSRNLLATGVAAVNVHRVIDNFVDTTTDGGSDRYFVRVLGTGHDYSLLLTRNAGFDTEPNNGLGPDAQDINASGAVLGYAGAPGGVVTELGKLIASDASSGHYFGRAVAVSGDTAIVGAGDCSSDNWIGGGAYIFKLEENRWIQQQKLVSPSTYGNDGFGCSVAISGDTAIVGAYTEDNPSIPGYHRQSGAAYVFRFDGSQWVEWQVLTASDLGDYDYFGVSVSVSGDNIMIGASGGYYSIGAAYVFHFDGSQWIEQQKLTASDGRRHNYFGKAVSVDGNTSVIGAPGDYGLTGLSSGSAYVFRFDGSQWVEQQKLTPCDAERRKQFARCLALSGGSLIVGTGVHDSAYVFQYDGSQWIERQKLSGDRHFGRSVDISGDMAIVGNPGYIYEEPDALAHVFRFDGTQWTEYAKLASSNPDPDDGFGYAVAIDGDRAIVGARTDSEQADEAGAAYAFLASSQFDCYAVEVQAGNILVMATSTPSDGPGALLNGLDPAIELYDPGGLLVGSDSHSAPDNCNALLTHLAGSTGVYTIRVRAENDTCGEYVLKVSFPDTAVVDRYVFYNNSAFDGDDPGADSRDNNAVATDKVALRPGGTARFENYTSYSRGVNGIMVDIAGPAGTPTVDDFGFRVGNDNDPAGWSPVAAAPDVTVRGGAGTGGADRVTIIWTDNLIQNQWLQLTVKATPNTGLAGPDVFYFGNAIGESGNSTTDAKVNAYDMLGARDNQRTFIHPAPIDFNYDYDRDARVNAYDMLIARDNQTHFLNALKLIRVPGGRATGEDAAALTQARAHDSVLRQAVADRSWLYEFEPARVPPRPDGKTRSVAEGVDQLLLANWPA